MKDKLMIIPFCWMIFSLSSCSLTSTNLVQNQRASDKFICPVCDREIPLASEAFSYKYNGKEKKYLFGTYVCREVFKRNPEKFIDNDTAKILTK